jgi:hypothetical protein
MLETLARLSAMLSKGSKLVVSFGFLSLLLLIYSQIFLPIAEQNIIAMPCLLAIIWSLLFNLLIKLFQNIPRKATLEQFIFKRWKQHILRSFYHAVAAGYLLLSIVIIYLTYKMFGVWVGVS